QLERRPLWRRAIPIVATALVVAAGTNIIDQITQNEPRLSLTRFSVVLPVDQRFANVARRVVAISPNGASVVYVANNEIYLRSMNDMQARSIQGGAEGTGLNTPIFSPDSQWVAFFTSGATEGALKKIAITGGSAVTISNALLNPNGASWS